MLRTILVLGRVSNLPTVWTNVLAGWFIAGGGWSSELGWLIAGVSLLYIAGMTLNDAFDAGWDREYAPERPIPSGAISRKAVWLLGFGQLAVGIAVILAMTNAAWVWMAALVAAILLYDAIHKKTPWAVAVMGTCRGLVYFVAGSAAGEWKVSAIAALVMVLYVGGITLSARLERSAEGRPRLFLCWMAMAICVGWVIFTAGLSYNVVLLAVFWMVPASLWTMYCFHVGTVEGIGPMIGRLIAGITLVDAYFIFVLAVPPYPYHSHGWLQAALVCALLLPVTLFLQRKVPAT